MSAVRQFDDNPCRPRHFKPPPCAPVVPDGPAKRALDGVRGRLFVASTAFLVLFAVVAARLVEVTLLPGDIAVPDIARFHPVPPPLPGRADIVDRNGVLLATTLETPSLFADPEQILDPAAATPPARPACPISTARELLAKLSSGKGFVWVKRHLTPREETRSTTSASRACNSSREGKRVYPEGNLSRMWSAIPTSTTRASPASSAASTTAAARRQRAGAAVARRAPAIHPARGDCSRSIDEFNAIGGMGIIMDVSTGEVLALVSLPDFDPNDPQLRTRIGHRRRRPDLQPRHARRLRDGLGVQDLHHRDGARRDVTTMTGGYDATNPIQIGRFTIHDDHGKRRWLTRAGNLRVFVEYRRGEDGARCRRRAAAGIPAPLGLLREPNFELKEIAAPLTSRRAWRPVNTMTIGFGHGISVSPLQIATAASAPSSMAASSIRATLLKLPTGEAPPGRRVISPETSIEMRKLLRLVVEHGTGKLAKAPGYLVGGKTGTAEKVAGDRYAQHALLSSFVGVFPINDPRYVVLVSIDEPHGNKADATASPPAAGSPRRPSGAPSSAWRSLRRNSSRSTKIRPKFAVL